jgi:hypothetical protein
MRRYSEGGFRRVQGWLEPISAEIIASLCEQQREMGLSGSACEIGVHHGKLLILLHEGTFSNERTIAIDVFEDQHLNTDGSGRGDKAQFLRNLKAWSDRSDFVDVVQSSSLDLRPSDILSRVDRVRIASIDGGHTSQCAEHDLRLVEGAAHDYAVIIVDDVFNATWPDVMVGLSRYCADPATKFRPFAISPNKLYLARPEHHEVYRTAMRNRWSRYFENDQKMFDHTVGIYGLAATKAPIKTRVKNILKTTPLFPALRAVKRKIAA